MGGIKLMKKFIYYFDYVENIVVLFATIAITLMMLLVSADTLGRHFLSLPITGVNEIVSSHLIVAVIYFGLSNALKTGEHVSVNVIVNRLPFRMKKITSIIVNILSILLFVLIFYQGFLLAFDSYVTNDNFIGSITYPRYTAYGLVPIGSLLIIVRLMINLIMIFKTKKEQGI